jgi:dienelactone hydrolase
LLQSPTFSPPLGEIEGASKPNHPLKTLSTLLILSLLAACNNNATNGTSSNNDSASKEITVQEETVSYQTDSVTAKSFVAYSSDTSAKKPIVLIIPEWWGLGDYIKNRARQLASEGYFAMAVDIYGNGKQGLTPDEAGKLATPFYTNPQLGYGRIQAALAKAVTYPGADSTKTAAIGYCFGGSMVLNAARMGMPLDGAVSFHGSLAGVTPQKGKTTAAILVLHGAADSFVPDAEVAKFKKQMDSTGTTYTFKAYDSATHAFTNPDATATGKKFNMPISYNAAADTASWKEMKQFFNKIF